ncbi:anaphase-promoting complex subunit 9-domain-containing protein [Zygosaccharomyces rouxii]|nr:anaphase-promoting complex subunit 9-domain-containing protein [Zygosaccharomyces rouxii]
MSRATKSNASKRDPNLPVESPLFQLPSVAPWRTPKLQKGSNPYSRYNSVTPLRRPSTLLIHHLEQAPVSSGKEELEIDTVLDENELSKEPSLPAEEAEYDYKPFSEKPLLRESKIESYLQAERAAHCLIFHTSGHIPGADDKYRPDAELECGEDEWEGQELNHDEGPLLLSVPGCSKHDLCQLLNKNHMRPRPNVRRIDEILNHEFNALKSFWGDSSLATTLDRNHLHEQYLLLMQEQKEIAQFKSLLHSSRPIKPHVPHN